MNTLPPDVEAFIKSAFCGQETSEKWESLADVGNRLRRMDSSFSYKNYGFSTLVQLLMRALPHLVEIKRDDTAGSPRYFGRLLLNSASSPAPIVASNEINMARYEKRGTNDNLIEITAEELLLAIAGNFDAIQLEYCVITGEVDISRSAIIPDVYSRYTIDKSLDCRSCVFNASLKLRNVIFKQAVSFNKTVFKRNADFIGSKFEKISIPGRSSVADFEGSIFKGSSSYKGAIFEGAVNFEDAHFEEGVKFNTRFHGNSIFNKTVFKKYTTFANAGFGLTADFKGTKFDGNVSFKRTFFGGDSSFNRSRFKGRAMFSRAKFKGFADFNGTNFLRHVYFTEIKCEKTLKFRDVDYRPDTFPKSLCHTPTEFHFDSQHLDEGSNPLFKRYVTDQQYIRSFRKTNCLLARIWRLTSDYGRSVGLWATWSMVFTLVFAVLYTPTPEWMPVWWQNWSSEYGTSLIQTTGHYEEETVTFLDCLYFSIVTFTTLGFGDVVANNGVTRVIVTLEVIFGYIMLGGLISIFANILARRS